MVTTHSFGKQLLRQEDGLAVVGEVPFFLSNSQSLLAVSSDNSLDGAGKEGARQIQIIGLDADFNRVSEVLFLKGTENVITKKEYVFVESVEVIQVGSFHHNKGTIRLSNSQGLLAKVSPKRNRMWTSTAVVPANMQGELYSWFGRINTQKGLAGVTFTLCQFLPSSGIVRPLEELAINPELIDGKQITYTKPISTSKASIFYVTAETNSDGVEVLAGLELSLESK